MTRTLLSPCSRTLRLLPLAAWFCLASFSDAQEAAAPQPDPAAVVAELRQLSERILQNTQTARDQLKGQRTDAPTQTSQQEVIQDLAKLIELLKQAPPPKPDQNSDSSKSDSSSSDKNQNQKPRDGSESAGASKPSGDGSGQDRNQPQDSEERQGENRDAKRTAERKRRLENDIWGHLPPSLREKLLNTYGERILPQYEDYVRKFYEQLSEPSRPAKPKTRP